MFSSRIEQIPEAVEDPKPPSAWQINPLAKMTTPHAHPTSHYEQQRRPDTLRTPQRWLNTLGTAKSLLRISI